MTLIHTLKKLTFWRVFAHFSRKFEFRFLPDSVYLKWLYRGSTGRKLNLEEPKRYTEYLQWMKIYDHNPLYTTMVDKAAAKEWAAEIIGSEHIIPTLGVWERFDDIDFGKLPNRFVLKCTHDSKSALICRDKTKFNISAAKEKLQKALTKEFFYEGRQWPYKNVPPRILAEAYMENDATGDLRDYKFFTFNGEPKTMYIATGRGTGQTYGDFFDMDFQHLDLSIDHEMAPQCPEKPALFEQMKEAARLLSKGTSQVRVDFYEVNGQFYFGEMTFFHCSGFVNFHPDSWDEKFGSWIQDLTGTMDADNA